MSDTFEPVENSSPIPERRCHPRQTVRSIAYIELGGGNGGIVLNVGEGGLAVQALMELDGDQFPGMRFQLAHPKNWVEANGQVAWTGESGKTAGMRFVDLAQGARTQILEWISSETSSREIHKEKPPHPEVKEPIPSAPAVEAGGHDPGPVRVNVIVEDGVEEGSRLSEAVVIPDTGVAEEILLPVNRIPEAASIPELARMETPLPVPTEPGPRPARGWALPALFGFFAIASLAAGWAAGRGNLLGVWKETRPETAQPSSANRSGALSPTSTTGQAFAIEIVDANNREWLVPFHGRVSPPRESPRPQEISNVPAPAHKPKIPSLGWISRPFPPARVVRSEDAESEGSPPTLNFPASPENALPSFGSPDTRNANSGPLPPGSLAAQQTGNLYLGQLIRRVEPVYPRTADQQGIEGTVRLHAVIRKDGTVGNLKVMSGDPSLVPAAMNAVRQWRYKPTLLDGHPIDIEQDIVIVFRLNR